MPKITQERYEEACESYEGWCKVCQDFTRAECEPDADKYPCPECKANTVVGAENALIMGLFEFSEEEGE